MNEELLMEFEQAVFLADSDKIRNLIEAGVPVDTRLPVGQPTETPLFLLLETSGDEIKDYMEDLNYDPSVIAKVPVGIYRQAKALECVKVFLEKGVKLFDKDEHIEGKNFIIEDLIYTSNKPALTEIALHTIEKTIDAGIKCYEILNANFYEKLYNDYTKRSDEAFISTLDDTRDILNALYIDVGMRLMSPHSLKDKEIKRKYEKFGKGVWTDRDEIPESDDIKAEMLKRNAHRKDVVKVENNQSRKIFVIGEDISKQKMTRTEENLSNEKDKIIPLEVFLLPKETPNDVFQDLEKLVDLEKEKRHFLKWAVEIMKRDKDDPEELIGYSSAYLGNPGTAKSALFRLKARFLHSMGLVGNKYVEVTAGNLEEGYIGQTAIKTRKVLDRADVLFIDEAYGLVKDKSSYGVEVINEIVAYTENNRSKPIFFAGYPGDMKKLFNMNSGLVSRVRDIHIIDDYSFETLEKIFDQGIVERGYKGIEPEAKEAFIKDIKFHKSMVGEKKFANGREVRKALEDLNGVVKSRIYKLNENLLSKDGELDVRGIFEKASSIPTVKKKNMTITLEDVKAVKIREWYLRTEEDEKRKIGMGRSV